MWLPAMAGSSARTCPLPQYRFRATYSSWRAFGDVLQRLDRCSADSTRARALSRAGKTILGTE